MADTNYTNFHESDVNVQRFNWLRGYRKPQTGRYTEKQRDFAVFDGQRRQVAPLGLEAINRLLRWSGGWGRRCQGNFVPDGCRRGAHGVTRPTTQGYATVCLVVVRGCFQSVNR